MSASTLTVADRIRYWREFFGLSLAELAERVGVSVQSARLWESRERGKNRGSPPTLDNLERIVSTFGITMAEFYGPIPVRRAS